MLVFFRKFQIILIFSMTFFILGACEIIDLEEELLEARFTSIEIDVCSLQTEYDIDEFELNKLS